MRTEMIAAVLGGGPRAMAAATRISEHIDSYELPCASAEELRLTGKLTPAQAARLHGAIRLAADLARPVQPGERFSNSRDVWERYRPRYYAENREHFVTILLDSTE